MSCRVFFSIQNDSYSESDVSQTHIVRNGEKKTQTNKKQNECMYSIQPIFVMAN